MIRTKKSPNFFSLNLFCESSLSVDYQLSFLLTVLIILIQFIGLHNGELNYYLLYKLEQS